MNIIKSVFNSLETLQNIISVLLAVKNVYDKKNRTTLRVRQIKINTIQLLLFCPVFQTIDINKYLYQVSTNRNKERLYSAPIELSANSMNC